MPGYGVLKSILMVILIVTALSFFYIRIRRLALLMVNVQGKCETAFDRVGERIGVLITDILGQSNVRRKVFPGLAHSLIFFGFLAVQPHSLELMIRGVAPSFHVHDYIPIAYGAYLRIADVLVFLAFLGLAYGLYRRLIVPPPYLTNGPDAKIIIAFVMVIIVTYHLLNAFLLLPAIGGESFDYAAVFTVSKVFERALSLSDLSPGAARAIYESIYWVHILTILGFLVYIPGSKHLHMLAAVPNVILKPLQRAKSISRTDLEAEGAQSFGMGKVSDLSWKGVLDLYACTECGRCEEQCPAAVTGKPLSPKHLVHDVKLDLLEQASPILQRSFEAVRPLIREGSKISGDVLWSCTTCRACEDICPVNIQHTDLVVEARKHQVLMEASFPPELQDTFTNLENQSNPWGFGNDTRADWAKGLEIPRLCDRPQAGVLFYVGCAGSFDDRGKKISQAIARVLLKAGVDFAILGEEERCNGDVARRCGNEYLAQTMVQENAAILNQYKPKKILTGCPHCYNTLKNDYPQFGANFDVVHTAEFMLELFRKQRLKVETPISQPAVFHDSCYLGRWNGIFAPPRELVSILSNGKGPIELGRKSDKGLCCGAGGGRMFMEEKTGKRINIERGEEIIASGACLTAAACPFCITMLRDGLADLSSKIDVKDIAELVDSAT